MSIPTGAIQPNAVGNARLAKGPGNTLKGNDTAVLADLTDITVNSNTVVGRGINNLADLTLDPSIIITAADVLKVPEVGSYFSFIMDTSSTADSDPGANKIKCNNANQTLATQWYLDDVDRSARDITGYIGTWGLGGTLLLTSSNSYLILNLQTITDATGYTKLIGVYAAGLGFANGDIIFLTYLDGATTPVYTDLADPALPSAVTYPNFTAIIANASGNTYGKPGIFKSNGTVYNGIGRQTIDHFNEDIFIYATNTAITWTVANSGGFLQLAASAAHGIAIANNYANSYLHIKTASGSFFPLDGLIQLDDVTSTTVILTSVAWNASMAGATPVFSMAGDKFKIATVAVPALRANSRIVIDVHWGYTNSANNKTVEMQFGGVVYYAPAAFTTTAVVFTPIEILNKNNTAVQASRFNSTTVAGSGTAGTVITSAIDTTAASSLTWHGTCASAGEYIGLRGRLIEVIY